MALFVDLYPLSQQATDDALEFIFKSSHNHDDGIWKPHESLLIRRLIELFTQRGLDRLAKVREQIIAWEAGEHHKPGAAHPVQRPGMMERWNEAELSLVRLYLESLPPAQWGIDDHMMAVDYVVQRYLPADELRTESEWLATRSGLMGKVQANLAAAVTAQAADKILAALPSTVGTATSQFNLNAQQKAALEFGRARCAENVRALTESVRHRLRNTIMQHMEERQTMAHGAYMPALQTKLQDEFATLNRDWRRIAVTEAGENQLQGYIASLKPGTKVKRVEVYANACGFCRKIDGTIATVIAADDPNKTKTSVWPGKNNVGRSASPRKRVGNVLVAREPHEMWHLPAGLAHPHCRGRWVPVIEDEPGDDPDFGDWLRATLG